MSDQEDPDYDESEGQEEEDDEEADEQGGEEGEGSPDGDEGEDKEKVSNLDVHSCKAESKTKFLMLNMSRTLFLAPFHEVEYVWCSIINIIFNELTNSSII